jgi:hypothetical protein
MTEPDRVQVALFRRDGGRWVSSVAGRPLEHGEAAAPTPYVGWEPQGLASVFEGVKRLIRPLVVALYLAPLLIAARLVFYLFNRPDGDWITVGFVGLVVVFFLLLAVMVLLFPFVGPRSTRKVAPALSLDTGLAGALGPLGLSSLRAQAPAEVADLCQSAAPGEMTPPLRFRGRVRAGGAPVLADRWLARGDTAARLLAGRPFVLEQDGPPVVVDPGAWVLLVDRYRGAGRSPLALPAGVGEELGRWTSRNSGGAITLEEILDKGRLAEVPDGSEIELVAPAGGRVIENIDELVVAGRRVMSVDERGGGAPYRADRVRRGLLLCGDHAAPLVLRVL